VSMGGASAGGCAGAPSIARRAAARARATSASAAPLPPSGTGSSAGARQLPRQLRHERGVVVAEEHRAHPAVRDRDEQPAERAVGGRVPHRDARGAALVGPGWHPEVRVRGRVGAGPGPVPRLEGGAGHGVAGAQPLAEPRRPRGVGVRARRHPDDARERPLQMVRAHPGGARQLGERHRPVGVRVQVGARRPDGGRPAARRRVVGAAASARAVAGEARIQRRAEEADVLAARAPRGARRSAVDAGGRDGEDEAAVGGAVAGDDRGPRLVVGPGGARGDGGGGDRRGWCGHERAPASGYTIGRPDATPAASPSASRPLPPNSARRTSRGAGGPSAMDARRRGSGGPRGPPPPRRPAERPGQHRPSTPRERPHDVPSPIRPPARLPEDFAVSHLDAATGPCRSRVPAPGWSLTSFSPPPPRGMCASESGLPRRGQRGADELSA
jgi:hypothetical protein